MFIKAGPLSLVQPEKSSKKIGIYAKVFLAECKHFVDLYRDSACLLHYGRITLGKCVVEKKPESDTKFYLRKDQDDDGGMIFEVNKAHEVEEWIEALRSTNTSPTKVQTTITFIGSPHVSKHASPAITPNASPSLSPSSPRHHASGQDTDDEGLTYSPSGSLLNLMKRNSPRISPIASPRLGSKSPNVALTVANHHVDSRRIRTSNSSRSCDSSRVSSPISVSPGKTAMRLSSNKVDSPGASSPRTELNGSSPGNTKVDASHLTSKLESLTMN